MTSNPNKKSTKSISVPRPIFLMLTTLALIGAVNVARLVLGISGLLIKIALFTATAVFLVGLAVFIVTFFFKVLRKPKQP